MRVLSLAIHKKDTMRIKDEVTLVSNKPNIEQLLWYTIDVRGMDLRPEDNVVKARGELSVFVLYSGEDEENPLQWAEYVLPFNTEVECTGCMGEMIPNIGFSVMHQSIEVKPDSDGEERVFSVDVVLELDMKIYREEEHCLILDAYSPLKECILHGKEECLESLLVRNASKCRVDRSQRDTGEDPSDLSQPGACKGGKNPNCRKWNSGRRCCFPENSVYYGK